MGYRCNHVLERYTPAEAEMVTGVKVALQRDWRRRGLLPETGGGHARYTAAALAEMVLMQDFARDGLGPKVLKDMLGTARDPLGLWVESIAWVEGVTDVENAIAQLQLPARYVVLAGGNAISTANLNDTLEALSDGADRRFAFVCNLRSVAEYVVAKLPRPVWCRQPGKLAKPVA